MLCDCWLKSAADHNGPQSAQVVRRMQNSLLTDFWAKLIGLYFGGAWTMKMMLYWHPPHSRQARSKR